MFLRGGKRREGGRNRGMKERKHVLGVKTQNRQMSAFCQNTIVIFFSAQKNWKSLQRRELEQKLITSFAFAYNWYAFRLRQ